MSSEGVKMFSHSHDEIETQNNHAKTKRFGGSPPTLYLGDDD